MYGRRAGVAAPTMPTLPEFRSKVGYFPYCWILAPFIKLGYFNAVSSQPLLLSFQWREEEEEEEEQKEEEEEQKRRRSTRTNAHRSFGALANREGDRRNKLTNRDRSKVGNN